MRKWLPGLLLLAPVLLPAQVEMEKSKKTPNAGPDCMPLNSDYLQQHNSALAASGGYETASGKILKVSQTHFTTPYDNDLCLCLKPDPKYENLLKNCMGISNAPDSLVACDPEKKNRALDLEVDLCRYRGSHCVEDDPDLALLKRALESLAKSGATIEARGVRVDDLKHDGGKSELHPVEVITARLNEAGQVRHRLIAVKNNPGPHAIGFWPPQSYHDNKTYRLALAFPPAENPRAKPVCEIHEYVNRRSSALDCYTLQPAGLSFTYEPATRALLTAVTPHLAHGNGRACEADVAERDGAEVGPPLTPRDFSSASTGLLVADIITRWESAPPGARPARKTGPNQPLSCKIFTHARWPEPAPPAADKSAPAPPR